MVSGNGMEWESMTMFITVLMFCPFDDSISTADGADMLSALRAFTFNPTNGDNKSTAHNVIETNAFLNIKNTSFINMNKVSNVCNKICEFMCIF